MTVSGAGILANADIEEMARQNGGQLVLATGALLGLDAVRAAAEAHDKFGENDYSEATQCAARCATLLIIK